MARQQCAFCAFSRYNDREGKLNHRNMSIIPKDFSGFVAVVKRDCDTCRLIAPALANWTSERELLVYSQDDPAFPANIDHVIDDRELELSYRLDIEIVPTLMRFDAGREADRLVGWRREDWRQLTGMPALGEGLPEFSPGCGSKSVEPGIPEKLAVKFGDSRLNARRINVAALQDEHELAFERGWSDGLPVVPPTEERVLRMLAGTARSPSEVVGIVPPNNVSCTVEKVSHQRGDGGLQAGLSAGGAGGG